MNILLLAPHPFYQERGTPIAVDLLLAALSRRGDRVDVVTFHEGAAKTYPGVSLHRIRRLPGISGIPPGFSLKKLLCDLLVLAKALRLAAHNNYQVVHAVEESVFMAMLIGRLRKIPYVFDMDSSMSGQLIEKFAPLKALAPLMRRMEGRAIRNALAVVPVCDALAQIAEAYKPRKLVVLRDVPLLPPQAPPGAEAPPGDWSELKHPRFLYIGNLERYQGIDLLLEAFKLLLKNKPGATLMIAGGKESDVRRYRARAAKAGLAANVRFAGPWPVARMAELFAMADALVSPRIQGSNTPMKIYSYLQSGKPIIATDLPTHTQALTPDVAVLAPPDPEHFSDAMRRLVESPDQGRAMAERARALAERQYSRPVFERTVEELYEWIERQVGPPGKGIGE